MASQEDYLDQLLQSVTEKEKENILNESDEDVNVDDIDALLQSVMDSQEEAPEESVGSDGTMVDDAANMSEEEISRLLSESQKIEDSGDGLSEEADGLDEEAFLNDILKEQDDADLKEIQELLQKSDNNEVIEAAIEDDAIENHVIEDNSEISQTVSKAEQKKQQRNARREAKKAEKEAKKAEREAKKAEKEAKKAEKEAGRAEKEAKKSTKVFKPSKKRSGTDGMDAVDAMNDNGEEPVEMIADDAYETLDVGVTDELPITEAIQENEEVTELSAEDALMKELEAFDFLSDVTGVEGNELEDISSASEDSLTQIIEKDEKEKPKKGLFARILDFISEEEEEELENEDIKLSDENQNILRDMDKEKKKGKKAKKKKGAKNGEESDSEGNQEGGKPEKKPKKEKKPKREKKPKKEVTEISGPVKKIPVKHIMMVVAVCASIGVAIILFVQVVGDNSTKQTARKAFYKGDYQTCYQNLFGKDLNETEQVMYGKSESILTIRIWLKEYELLAAEGQELKALDSLLQSVHDYPTLYAYSETWHADTEVTEVYNQMLTILSGKYHLSEEQAKEIADIPDDIDYTKRVMAVVQGDAYSAGSEEEPVDKPQDVLENPLPEESELGSSDFVDNANVTE